MFRCRKEECGAFLPTERGRKIHESRLHKDLTEEDKARVEEAEAIKERKRAESGVWQYRCPVCGFEITCYVKLMEPPTHGGRHSTEIMNLI